MPKKMPAQRSFHLEEYPSVVVGLLNAEDGTGFAVQYPAEQVGIRCKTLTKTELANVGRSQSTNTGETPVEVLEHYIRSRDKKILAELNNIRRAIKRIAKMTLAIENAQAAIEELKHEAD